MSTNPHRFQGKVALVTGAASGIGRATVRKLAAEGATVVATDIDPAGLDRLAGELAAAGTSIHVQTGNVAAAADAAAMVDYTVRTCGGLHILVNSAGITPRTLGPDATLEERWDAVMGVNAKGSMLMCHAAVDAMRNNGGGAIVNVASIMGLVGYPTGLPFSDGFSPYPQSKGAVVQLTRDLGVRVAAEGIRVNAVCPGFVYTALTANVVGDAEVHARMQRAHPIGRMGQSEEVANVIAFLASDEASFVVAATWTVDGGYTAQ